MIFLPGLFFIEYLKRGMIMRTKIIILLVVLFLGIAGVIVVKSFADKNSDNSVIGNNNKLQTSGSKPSKNILSNVTDTDKDDIETKKHSGTQAGDTNNKKIILPGGRIADNTDKDNIKKNKRSDIKPREIPDIVGFVKTLIKIDNNTSIDLHEKNKSFPERVTKNGYKYTSEWDTQIVYNDRLNNSKRIIYFEHNIYHPKALFTLDKMPIYDAIIDSNMERFRFISQYDFDISIREIYLSDNLAQTMSETNFITIYKIRWIPDLNVGKLKSIYFLTPDIIRIENTVGTIYHVRLSEELINDENWLGGELVWWNGVGDIVPLELLFQKMDKIDIKNIVDNSEPAYDQGDWKNWYKMDRTGLTYEYGDWRYWN